MPLVQLECEKAEAPKQRKPCSLLCMALVEAFRISEDDRQQRLVEYRATDSQASSTSGDIVLVTIDAFPGHSMKAKKKLYTIDSTLWAWILWTLSSCSMRSS